MSTDDKLDSILAAEEAIEADLGALSVVTMLRNAQQHHVQLSAMADLKANIIITASSVLLTFAITQVTNDDLQVAMIVLSLFSLVALALGVFTVLPKFRPQQLETGGRLPASFNLLFFGHFAALDQARYLEEIHQLVAKGEGAIVEASAKDIYQIGVYLQAHKYRYLRYAYLFFLGGLVAAGAIQIVNAVA